MGKRARHMNRAGSPDVATAASEGVILAANDNRGGAIETFSFGVLSRC